MYMGDFYDYIKQKRLVYMLSMVAVAVLVFSIGITETKEKTIETVATPASNKVIVIDAGHGIPDEGYLTLKL